MKKIDPVVDEAIETLNMKDGPTRRKLLKGTGLFSATAAASALISACSSSTNSNASTAKDVAGNFPKTPKWQFWFDNHVYTNVFFVPTQYGFQDAAALLGLPKPRWGGSASTSSVSQMVSFFNEAVAAKAGGIATTVINSTGFTEPIAKAMNDGIPVVTYNSDGTYVNGKPEIGSNRLAYVGQALYLSGQAMGNEIMKLIPTPSEIAIFIATPGTGNIQPRFDGAKSVLAPKGYTVHEVGTNSSSSLELPAQKAYLLAHKNIKGAFAVDATDTAFLTSALAASGLSHLPHGGFDTAPQTLSALKAGKMDFTIYQDPYLQGFLPTLYLYLYNLSGGQLPPPDTDTGLTVITKDAISTYEKQGRYVGQVSTEKYIPRPSGPINNPMATTST